MIALVLLGALGPCAELALCSARVRATPAELLPAAKAALAMASLSEGEPAKPQPIAAKTLRGDTAFAIEVEQQGADFIVRALSLHRPASIFGLARATPPALPKRQRAIEIALRGAITRAMEDLSAQLAEAAGQGKRTLKLSVRVNGLDLTARRHASEVFFPCLRGQFDALGAVTEPREVAGYLEDVIEYAPAKDEPREPLQWQADRLRALTLGMKAQCPPPAKYAAAFSADPVNRGVIIELR